MIDTRFLDALNQENNKNPLLAEWIYLIPEDTAKLLSDAITQKRECLRREMYSARIAFGDKKSDASLEDLVKAFVSDLNGRLPTEIPPRDFGSEMLYFFTFGESVKDEQVSSGYAMRGMAPCSPHLLVYYSQVEPLFFQQHPVVTVIPVQKGFWVFSIYDGVVTSDVISDQSMESYVFPSDVHFAGVDAKK